MGVSLQQMIEQVLINYNLDPGKLKPEMVTIGFKNGNTCTGPNKPNAADLESGIKSVWINHPDGEDLVEIEIG